eukprot:3630040-Pyramimonas_sp.AAC.1
MGEQTSRPYPCSRFSYLHGRQEGMAHVRLFCSIRCSGTFCCFAHGDAECSYRAPSSSAPAASRKVGPTVHRGSAGASKVSTGAPTRPPSAPPAEWEGVIQ